MATDEPLDPQSDPGSELTPSASEYQPVEADSGPDPATYNLQHDNSESADGEAVFRIQPAVSQTPIRRGKPDRFRGRLLYCNLVVFVTSVCIMVLELAASRLIAKHVGSSLYTWTSVIGVVLAGITIGNYVGGRLADRYDPPAVLPLLFITASVLCFGVLWMDQLAGSQERPDDWSWAAWVLTLVAEIFLLPSLALGTISPVVAALALSRSQRTGATVGNIYAWGAAGSIVGTFLAGFILIDQFGTRAIISITSVVLALMAVASARGRRTFRTAVLLGWLQFMTVMSLCAIATEQGLARAISAPVQVWTGRSTSDVVVNLEADVRRDVLQWWGQRFGTRFDKGSWELLRNWQTSQTGELQTIELTRRLGIQLDPQAGSETLAWLGRRTESDALAVSAAHLGWRLGRQLHELGLILRLRDDGTDEYHDESHYSHISVFSDTDYGNDVRALQLDKLVHSYYDPQDPAQLYYEYEQIYAAVTERTVADWSRATRLDLDEFPGSQQVLRRLHSSRMLPDWLQFDADQNSIRTVGPLTPARRRELLRLSPIGAYWQALESLQRQTSAPDWGGFTAFDLQSLPAGAEIPPRWSRVIQHDPRLEKLTCYAAVTADAVVQLVDAAPDAGYYHMLAAMRDRSSRVSTLFLGGGGFIFPRWIEARFPWKPRIDVAELDPAVKQAVHAELGLVHDSRTAITTRLGDARNVVDDLIRENRQRSEPVSYDFVYGDAFNDFSIPWHLTTREFTRKVRRLMKSDGVYMINVIDIFPRTVFPANRRGLGESTLRGRLPDFITRELLFNRWNTVAEFPHMQIKPTGTQAYLVRYDAVMSLKDKLALDASCNGYDAFQLVVDELYEQTRAHRGFAGELPQTLIDADALVLGWSASRVCPALEVMPLIGSDTQSSGKYALGFRGAMTDEIRDQLRGIAPGNTEFRRAIDDLYVRSRGQTAGRFLGRFVQTVADVFTHVYVFSSTQGLPHDDRDTFVIVCSDRPVNHRQLAQHWNDGPFAEIERDARSGRIAFSGQMATLLQLGQGLRLTDNYAPVENLLAPVITRQDD